MNWLKLFVSKLEKTLPLVMLKNLFRLRWILLLGGIVWVHAIGVAYVTHLTRSQTAHLEDLKHRQYELEMEWEALRLEQGALAEHNRIESIARKKLAMKNVAATDEILIKDDNH
ncbi:cell division protein FtsL [Pleionea sediminis]|uniref:cell division protein FtsL n=1 Tax=Pleionea sediminis TaxID=2569479 RepID=UPI001184BD6B|nr:cell division protein FtsL [Pleionea sediminis]